MREIKQCGYLKSTNCCLSGYHYWSDCNLKSILRKFCQFKKVRRLCSALKRRHIFEMHSASCTQKFWVKNSELCCSVPNLQQKFQNFQNFAPPTNIWMKIESRSTYRTSLVTIPYRDSVWSKWTKHVVWISKKR